MNTPENMTDSEPVAAPSIPVGATLREARERAGLSVADVASRIKFAPRQVEALEAEDFAHLPESAFLRGFVRSYARLLQIDEVPLLAALPQNKVHTTVSVSTSLVDAPFPSAKRDRKVNAFWLFGAAGVGLLIILFLSLHGNEAPVMPTEPVLAQPAVPEAASAVAEAVTEAPLVQEAPPEVQTEKPQVVQKTPEPPKKQAPVKLVEVPKKLEPVKLPEPEKPQPERKKRTEHKEVPPVVSAEPLAAASAPAATEKPAIPLEVLKRRPMRFVFNEASWVEVVDANGSLLLSRTGQRGTEQWIGGPRRAPYDVSIANPKGVKLYYKGKEVDLSSYAGSAVTHLKVE